MHSALQMGLCTVRSMNGVLAEEIADGDSLASVGCALGCCNGALKLVGALLCVGGDLGGTVLLS